MLARERTGPLHLSQGLGVGLEGLTPEPGAPLAIILHVPPVDILLPLSWGTLWLTHSPVQALLPSARSPQEAVGVGVHLKKHSHTSQAVRCSRRSEVFKGGG